MLIEIVSNCAFPLELRRKKWQQWSRYNDILNFRMCSKRMKRQKKKDLLFGVHRFRSIFAFNKLDLYNSHSYLQRPKDSAALFFLLLRQNKSQYITCNFQSNKARYYWTLTTYQKKTILYASFVVQVPFIYEHTWVFLFNLYTIKSDILKSATEISTGKVFNKTFAWCVSALPNV